MSRAWHAVGREVAFICHGGSRLHGVVGMGMRHCHAAFSLHFFITCPNAVRRRHFGRSAGAAPAQQPSRPCAGQPAQCAAGHAHVVLPAQRCVSSWSRVAGLASRRCHAAADFASILRSAHGVLHHASSLHATHGMSHAMPIPPCACVAGLPSGGDMGPHYRLYGATLFLFGLSIRWELRSSRAAACHARWKWK